MIKLIISCVALAFVDAASPADLISEEGMPLFQLEISEGFQLSVSILVRSAPSDEDTPGYADFRISVALPGTEAVSADCLREPYFFDEGALVFDPYGDDDSCTGRYRLAINSMLGPNLVKAPIPLMWDAADKSLTVSIGAEVAIPYVKHVKEEVLLL